jgi:hypothetical protein
MPPAYLVVVRPLLGSDFLYKFLVCHTYMTSVTLNCEGIFNAYGGTLKGIIVTGLNNI